MPTFPTATGTVVVPVDHATGVASWLWALALRVAVLGWHSTVRNGEPPKECMDDALDECGLIW